MRILSFVFAALLWAFSSFGQEAGCHCPDVLDRVIKKVDSNYLGLRYAVLKGDTLVYHKRKLAYQKQSAAIKPADCTRFVQDFLSFFKDGHLFVMEQPVYSKEELKQYSEKIKGSTINIAKLQQEISRSKDPKSIIGRWTDGISVIGIIKQKGNYQGYIIETTDSTMQPGELKAVFKPRADKFDVTYYSYKYAPKYFEAALYKEGSLLAGAVVWGRMESSYSREIAMINKKDVQAPMIIAVDSHTTLFSIPSFLYEWGKFKKLVNDNAALLTNSETIIFDIRGNTGGNAIYFNFIEMIADKTVFPASQGYVLASADTRDYYKRMLRNGQKLYGKVVSDIESNMGAIVDGPAYPADTLQLVPNKIKRVAILTDRACASAAESFILHSKAVSSKIMVFGSPTHGMIDYTSVNSIPIPSGSQRIYFGYPTSSLHRDIPENGYNKTGIIPDVRIDAAVKDKIAFIMAYYQQAQ